MKTFFILAILAFLGLNDGGSSAGQQGNDAYHAKKYQEARRHYQNGIKSLNTVGGNTASALQNNLGATFFRQKKYSEAQQAFELAATQAQNRGDLARAHYNAGNAALMQKNNEQALLNWRKALLANPQDDAARYNYELLSRMMQQNQNNQQNQDNQKEKDKKDQNQQNQNNQQNQGNQKEKDKKDQNQNNQNNQKEKDKKDKKDKEKGKQNPKEDGEAPKPKPNIKENEANQILNAQSADERDLLQQVRRRPFRQRVLEQDW